MTITDAVSSGVTQFKDLVDSVSLAADTANDHMYSKVA